MPQPLDSIRHGAESIWGNKMFVSKGEKILLNASSGKGKSTFTFTALGLRSDYSGEVFYDDKNINTFQPHDWTIIRQKKVSVIFQDLQLFPELTVGENLLLKNSLQNVFNEQEIRGMLRALDIENKWDQNCQFLSMGQQQRVAIVRALCQPFEILLMDEPFSHLDTENSLKCISLINERCDKIGAGFVLTTLGDDHGFKYDHIYYL